MRLTLCAAAVSVAVLGGGLTARDQPPVLGYDDTPMQPDGRWHIHDARRPQPPIVTPGPAPATPAAAPSDAVVLLGAREDLSAWQMMDGSAATWKMANGVLETGKGFLRTKAEFTDIQLHVEFATPSEVNGDSQGRGNSGVFLAGRFEIQDPLRNPRPPPSQRHEKERGGARSSAPANVPRGSASPARAESLGLGQMAGHLSQQRGTMTIMAAREERP